MNKKLNLEKRRALSAEGLLDEMPSVEACEAAEQVGEARAVPKKGELPFGYPPAGRSTCRPTPGSSGGGGGIGKGASRVRPRERCRW